VAFANLKIGRSYKTNKHDIVREFYVPALTTSVMYKRAVGFFSSTALIDLSKGLSGLIKNGGKIRFIVSPLLSSEDIDAIKQGYDARKIVDGALEREFTDPVTDSDKERLNWLAQLIATGCMEIKVAFTPPHKATGMYHEKIGIIYDERGERLAFTGSLNETINAFHNNYESIVVFSSLDPLDKLRVEDLERDFDALWAGKEKNISVLEFPEALKKKLLKYRKNQQNLDLDMQECFDDDSIDEAPPEEEGVPCLPRGFKLHDYQEDAINEWARQGYCGIFDMATGTGKTYTGLGAVTRLYNDVQKLAIIIVCPYQHLVEQWVEDIVKFNMRPVIGYSASVQKDWKNRLKNEIIDFKLDIINTFCFITTNATFASPYVQNEMCKLGKHTLLLIDEAHNFGAQHLSQTLDSRYQYRLALSATLERHEDAEGTQKLYSFFGKKCIEYGLDRAIKEEKLTPYYYFPKVVYLTEEELDKYRELSKKIVKHCHKDGSGRMKISETGKQLLIERARIVAGASNKLVLLRELMQAHVHDTHMLVYCGATRYFNSDNDTSEIDTDGERQIVAVSKMLGHELGMKVTHFTSSENAAEREAIKRQFAAADPYQAIVAIKCLDEGVNIPSISTAFILASSTNPKEYIQRRGRVLRKAPNKPFATIYDFVTLPRPFDCVSLDSNTSQEGLSLVKKEIRRMLEFGEISLNPSEANMLVEELSELYGLDLLHLDTEEDEFDGEAT